MPATQTAFERRTHDHFNALMWALANPGRPQQLRALEAGSSGFAAIAESLLDLEVTAHTSDPTLEPALRATGARIVALEDAQYLFLPDLETAGLDGLQRAERGSALYPDRAATLVIGASFETGDRVRLSGAGIQSPLETRINLPKAFWQMRQEVIAFPIGWDVIFVDQARIIGLPRTTLAEVI